MLYYTLMKLTRDQVLKIAQLARLALQPQEIERFQTELSAILNYVEQLNTVDTSQVEPTSQVTGLENRTRPDVVTYTFTREQMFASAIETAEGHVKVKTVLRK